MQTTGPTNIWCNVSPGIRSASILRLLDRIASEIDGIEVTLTASRGVELPQTPPNSVSYADRPLDLRQTMDRFIAETHPQVAIFAGSDVLPAAIDACTGAGVPMVLICGDTTPHSGLRRRWKDFRLRSRVRQLKHVFASSAKDAQHLRRLGAETDRIEVVGPLEEGSDTLTCDEQEWDALIDLTSARPLWLAAMIRKSELPAIEEAQRIASRLSHRLLLLVVPEFPGDGPEIAEWFRERGWQSGLRSEGVDPEPDVQVYIADEADELGLWYRLAPISFVGTSLSLADGGGHDPYAPAALGSAIVHGVHVADHGAAFHRLAESGGTREVQSGSELGSAISELLSPDRAARQAHRAWETTFQGTEASERILAAIRRLTKERVV